MYTHIRYDTLLRANVVPTLKERQPTHSLEYTSIGSILAYQMYYS